MEGRPALASRQVDLICWRQRDWGHHGRQGGIAFHRHRCRHPSPHKARPKSSDKPPGQIRQFPRLSACGKLRRRSGRATIGAQRRRHHGHHHRLPSSIHAPHTITRHASSVKNPFLNCPDPSANHTHGQPSGHPFAQLLGIGQAYRAIVFALHSPEPDSVSAALFRRPVACRMFIVCIALNMED